MAFMWRMLVGLVATVGVATGTVCESAPDSSGGGATPIILPPPKSLTLTSYSLTCSSDPPNSVYNNAEYADGNGPRGATNASDCCATCATVDGCNFWSYNVDPTLPKDAPCRWGTLTHCCFLHSAGDNLTTLTPGQGSNQFGAKGNWWSGSVQPTAAVPSLERSAEGNGPTERSGLTAGPLKSELEISAAKTSIVAADPTLAPLAQLLSDDIYLLSGIRLNVSATASLGDITFGLVKPAAEWEGAAHLAPDAEKYSLAIDGRGVAVECTGYTGCAWGVSTLLQTLCISGVPYQTAAFPSYNVTDWPDAPYRGMLVDTARSLVTPHDLMDAAQTARFNKIKYLHLHMTDDHAWTFPSKAFPMLGNDNIGFRGRTPRVYTEAELNEVVKYADTRGVTIIPELEGPGHSSAMRRSNPAFNGEGGDTPQGGGVINAANQSVYDGMATIVQEMADIFQSSPYIHVGCDETSTPPSLPGYPEFAAKHNISDGEDLFAYYVKTMADAVKSTGKQAMIWGPAAMQRLEPNDAVVMVWQGSDGVAQEAERHGLKWINCPNGGSNQTAEFGRDVVDFGDVPGTSKPSLNHSSPGMLGVQTNMWEKGWGWLTTKPFTQGSDILLGTTYVDNAVSRTAGAGWWAKTWPREVSDPSCSNPNMNSSAWARAYGIAAYIQSRLNPDCDATI